MEIYSSKFQGNIIRVMEKYPPILEFFRRAARGRAIEVAGDLDLKNNIKEGDRVLYLGAGTGHIAQLISEKSKADVTALDLEDLRTSDTKDIAFVQGNAENLPFINSSFDALTCVDMMHHCKNQERVFDEVCRVLKPGGRLLLHEETIPEQASEPNRSLIKILISIVDDIVNLQPLGTNPYNFRSTKEWISFAAKHGFKYSSRRSHTWGISDLLPKVLKSSNRHSRSIGRIFETTGFVFTKI